MEAEEARRKSRILASAKIRIIFGHISIFICFCSADCLHLVSRRSATIIIDKYN